ncbi:MAG: Uma2 family endonuclease [Pyrinomonadaceae bacterium]
MSQEILTETLPSRIVPTTFSEKILPKEKMSFEEFLDWLDEDTWAEWVDGEITIMSPASIKHQILAAFLQSILQHWIEHHKAGIVFPAPTLMKTETRPSGREPDVLFVAKENLGKLRENYLEGAADLIIEIISPESVFRDTQDKFAEYEAAGVKEYWIIDYNRRTANFYGFDENKKYKLLSLSADKRFESRVIEGLWINTEWLWQEPLPNLMDVLKEWKLV